MANILTSLESLTLYILEDGEKNSISPVTYLLGDLGLLVYLKASYTPSQFGLSCVIEGQSTNRRSIGRPREGRAADYAYCMSGSQTLLMSRFMNCSQYLQRLPPHYGLRAGHVFGPGVSAPPSLLLY